MRHNPKQETMFDDFAANTYRASPAVPASGLAAQTRETSEQAAESIKPSVSGMRLFVLGYIVRAGHFGSTDQECQTGLQMGANTQRPRRIELAAAGLIEPNGLKRKTASGRNAVVWVATQKGKAVIADGNRDD